MPKDKGVIVLMGSGELTGTMVELHKELLRPYGNQAKAVFIDTPAGFQLNVDHIAAKAVHYFQTRVGRTLSVASDKSALTNGLVQETARNRIRSADYMLIGPGSPTYAVRKWRDSAVPALMIERIAAGACLVAASAAALTVGRLTLPVYEIYKVGEDLHWVSGIDILGRFGFNMAVIPHWNNAEGGNHDTRFCFMGAPRFARLEKLISEPLDILGLDEHTALVLDLAGQQATVRGLGRVVLRRAGREMVFARGDNLPFSLLRGGTIQSGAMGASAASAAGGHPSSSDPGAAPDSSKLAPGAPDQAVWQRLHELENEIQAGLSGRRFEQAANSLKEMESLIWREQQLLQDTDSLGAARELLREGVAWLGSAVAQLPADSESCLSPLVTALLDWRERLRGLGRYQDADMIRDCLRAARVLVEDEPVGPRWWISE